MAVALAELIYKYRHNRKMLLFIVYIALFLDNMLLTTVVPIIPEYLLRLSHPNSTDLLLYNKIPITAHSRGKRAAFTENEKGTQETGNEQQPFIWDDAWEIPMDMHVATEWQKSPLNPFRKNKILRKKPSEKGKTSGTVVHMETITTEASITNENTKLDQRVMPNTAEEIRRHNTLAEENVYVGLMFGSKALVQLLTNPWIGPLTNKIGYTVPMFTGFCVMFLSTVMFTFGTSFAVLWLARALQGVGSACTSTSGMGMLAQAYPNDEERGSAMGIALGGLALGLLVGPPYGGVLYQWSGKELPFLLLALLALFDGSLQFLVLQPRIDRGEPEGTGLKELATDPYIIVAAGSITVGNLGIAMLEPSLPLWMMESWQASSFERGIAFLPASMSYLIGTNIFGPLAHKIGRWLSSFLGLMIIGVCLIAIPRAQGVGGLMVPNFFMGFSIGMIDASMFPLMGHLVDIRHVGVYGSIYAIADAAFCFAFALGPFFSGPLVRSVGFASMLRIIAVINFLYAPLMLFLRNPPATNKINEVMIEQVKTKKYANDVYEQIDGATDLAHPEIRLFEGYHY
ncbi:abnormal catecholamine distribution protein 1 [Loa loa]|uniref:Abnormal catecholamine distribution protein 1 n=1 Tax=Loa loa TaxID=7209 RepID=A0A1S0TRC7_LOALO|nr:abnormal catecholamine distribution protein 1 [Loa loa]EFO18719.1 abnormal catecholamine distribution protein 1 [Loa loa]